MAAERSRPRPSKLRPLGPPPGSLTQGGSAPYRLFRLKLIFSFRFSIMQSTGSHCVSILSLAPGQRARLCDHLPNAQIPARLRDLGFVGGTEIEVMRHAPLGDPWEILIRGYRMCLRRNELRTLCATLLP